MEGLRLVRPDMSYARQIAEYREEFLAAGSSMDGCSSLRRVSDPAAFIRQCAAYANKETVPEGRVTATLFLLVRAKDDKLLGMIQIRHYLNDFLEKYGGHIGYSIRPSQRRRGYAREMLRLGLAYCRTLGLKRVLITCIDGNLGSERTILANGGIYEKTVYEPGEGVSLKRFWISL